MSVVDGIRRVVISAGGGRIITFIEILNVIFFHWSQVVFVTHSCFERRLALRGEEQWVLILVLIQDLNAVRLGLVRRSDIFKLIY